MTDNEALNFATRNNVSIESLKDDIRWTTTIRMRRGAYISEREINHEDFYSAGFGLTIRIMLRSMLREIEEAEKEEAEKIGGR